MSLAHIKKTNLTCFNKDKFYLGTLCPQFHRYKDTNFTLRKFVGRTPSGPCVECDKAQKRRYAKKRREKNKSIKITDEKNYVGNLCKYGHKYNGVNKSLRSIKKGECLECKRLKSKKFYRNNKDFFIERDRKNIDSLSDKYVKDVIVHNDNIPREFISDDIIELRREILSFGRLMKETRKLSLIK